MRITENFTIVFQGALLDSKGVLQARKEEIGFMHDFLVYEKVPREMLAETDGTLIDTRW